MQGKHPLFNRDSCFAIFDASLILPEISLPTYTEIIHSQTIAHIIYSHTLNTHRGDRNSKMQNAMPEDNTANTGTATPATAVNLQWEYPPGAGTTRQAARCRSD